MNASGSARIERRPRRMTRFALMTAIIALSISGCGGSGSGEPKSSTPTGTLAVAVTDVFGDPVSGARVYLSAAGQSEPAAGATDAGGRFSFAKIRAGSVEVSAVAPSGSSSAGFSWNSGGVRLPENGHLELAGTVRPTAQLLWATPAVWVDAGEAAANGRSLMLTFHVFQLLPELGPFDLYLRRCEPDTQNDTRVHQAECVEGPDGFDAPYDAPGFEKPLAGATIPGSPPAPFAATLLLDQSRNMFVNDPWDLRLFAVKYFLTTLRADDLVALAAFASNDFAAGHRTQLSQAPVTMFPGENPRFAAADHTLFPIIDSLGTLEGGAAPLYSAIDKMLDFTAANASASGRRAVVVLTDGQDDTCGSEAECAVALRGVIDKSRATGVAIIAVGLASPTGQLNLAALRQLADGSGGAALWVSEPRQLATLFGDLRNVLDGSAAIYTARYRIESSTDGTFQSGRTVLGTVSAALDNPLEQLTDEDEFVPRVPFTVRIP